jgi:hypothetical protein
MARQEGIIKLTGTIGDITFYKTADGYLARAKSSLDKARVATDSAFARTREASAEFAAAAKAGKLVREALRPWSHSLADNKLTSRLLKQMLLVKAHDYRNPRGKRKVSEAIHTPAARDILKGFDLNMAAPLALVLRKQPRLNTRTGVCTIKDFLPAADLAFPAGATHAIIQMAWAKIDFSGNKYQMNSSEEIRLAKETPVQELRLQASSPPLSAGTDIFLLKICFAQEIEGVSYLLNNRQHTAMALVELA